MTLDQKTYFFLPKQQPLLEDMVAVIPLSFSFRTDHYDLLLESRVLGLEPEFQAKIGNIISQLYGRVGTVDLFDHEWDDKKTRNYINELLSDLNLVQVPDRSFIEYIQSNLKDESQEPTIDALIQECQALKVREEKFRPMKNEIVKAIERAMIKLFEDKDKVALLSSMTKPDLSREIRKILRPTHENS